MPSSASASVEGGGSGSTAMRAPSRSFSDAFFTTPSTLTPPCSIQRWSSERDGPPSTADSVDARNRSSLAPAASRGTTSRIGRTRSPDLGLDVSLRLDEDVDEGAVVEVLGIELGRDAALVERATFFDFLCQGLEEVVARD